MNESERNPEIVVFAGPNGSGKSTISQMFKPVMDYINADEIKKALFCTDLKAAQIAEQIREEHLMNCKDFCFETVLSTERNLNLIKRAKANGYFIRCFYIVTADPSINIARVKTRVAAGGHDVPQEKIIKRYFRSLDLIKEVIPFCDVCNIYDNSSRLFRIFKKRKNKYYFDTNEDWNFEDISLLTNLQNLEYKSLN